MSLKQRMPFLRWSVLRMAVSVGARNIEKTGQIGDGRETAAAEFVIANACKGDIDDIIATIDKFAYEKSYLINVGDERAKSSTPQCAAPTPNSPSSSARTAATAHCASPAPRRTPRCTPSNWPRPTPQSPGASGRTPASPTASRASSAPSGDGGHTLDALANEHGFAAGKLDFLFIDHDKGAYLPDLQSILDRGWLHPGSIVVAGNILIPGSPRYREYINQQQGRLFNTVEH